MHAEQNRQVRFTLVLGDILSVAQPQSILSGSRISLLLCGNPLSRQHFVLSPSL